ncbi:MAG: tail fiber domain-containing protein [Wenzhouxiangella sp.]|jgi:hypothetical protein|nr:tail fiber domain-containing protein [Wenzhouxiangella sp.]
MRALFLFLKLSLASLPAAAQPDTTITYQGQLQGVSGPFTGTPDMEFRLFDSLTDGNQIGTEVVVPAVPVADGLFQVELDFGASYGVEPTFLEVMVDGETLTPRQQISAVPLALKALALDGEYADRSFWRIGGNAGTTPGTDFVGTTDEVAFELHVDHNRALRIEPFAPDPGSDWFYGAANIIGGWAHNYVINGAVGATISGGGGEWDVLHEEEPNIIGGSFSTIAGGAGNHVGSSYSTVGGGINNSAGAFGEIGEFSTISGGFENVANASYATIPGGWNNRANGDFSFAAGKSARADNDGAFVWGDSTSSGFESTGNDQFLIKASGGVGIGTNSPARDLHIKQRSTNNAEIGLQIERSGASTNNWGFYIATSDNLGFRYNDTLMSRINASDGAYVALSDARAKHSVEPLTGVLDRLLKLRPSSYRMEVGASSQTRSTGLIAQEVRELFPSSVSVQDGLHGIKYSEITVLNTAALIELNERYSNRIAELESESARRFAALEAESAALRELAERNRNLEKRLAALESILLANERVVRSD